MAKKKKQDNAPVWLAFVADWHINSTIGLCPGPVQLDDGGQYQPSDEQAWLWDRWREFWAEVGTLDGNRVAVVVGDVVESFHHGSVQLITLNQAVELDAAVAAAGPMLNAVDQVYVIRGTEAHGGGAGFKEELFAKRIGATSDGNGNTSRWHMAQQFGGVRFDVAHHPRTSSMVTYSRDWAAARQASQVALEYDEERVDRPDVVIRAHCHYLGRGYHRDTLAVFLPPWVLTTAFGYRKGAGHRVEPPGGVLFQCKGGEYTWRPRTYKPPRAAPW